MKKFLALFLVVVMVALSLAACGKKKPAAEYQRADESEVYQAILGEYEKLIAAAKSAASINEKFVLFAKAEAFLLDSAVMIPTTTQGGAYTFSRVAPHTVPYVQWGNDDDRVKSIVIADTPITKTDRAALLAAWEKACAGEGNYDPAAMLTEKGYTLRNAYKTTFSTAPVTFDWLNTSSQSDTEITVNTVDGLVEYDNLNHMNKALATDWTISEDGKTYTFQIREGVKWYKADGTEYAALTAKDFECGFRHMLDAAAGLEWLVDGVIAGVHEYLGGGEWANVGYKASEDGKTLTVTLVEPTSYFLTMLTYSCFLPICDSFYRSQGGVYGIDEYKAATNKDKDGNIQSETYTYGLNTNPASQVYCGPFIIDHMNDTEIVLKKNENYYAADKVTVNSLTWVHDSGENVQQTYNDAKSGVYLGTGLNATLLELAKKEKLVETDTETIFEKYVYISDTTSTTYFGGLNLDRGTFELQAGTVKSPKTEQQKIDTFTALQNKNFRQALQFGFDRATWNAISRGEDLKTTNMRNMYTHPQFVSLDANVTVEGKTWTAGTFYGEIVQYYLKEVYKSHIKVDDGIDGWFNATAAKAALEKAKEELGDKVTFPITIDVVYYSAATVNTAQAQAYKKGIEETLGAENVVVNLVEATTDTDFYASGYRAADGKSGNYDMFYGSGWGPDYGDPSTYLDTFLGYGAGYMTKVIGLF